MPVLKQNIFLIFCIITSSIGLSQTISYKDYRKFKSTLESCEELLEEGKYKRCQKKLCAFKENQIPYGLRKSYYSNLGECFLQLGMFDLSKKNYEKSFLAGLNAKYFDYLKSAIPTDQKQKTDFLKYLISSYDSINKSLLIPTYLERKEVILRITNTDQEVRNQYINSTNKEPEHLKLLNNLVTETDSINQRIFDSLCTIYGWIGRDMVLPELRNIHIVLFHASEEYRNKYIQLGYKQATNNQIDWKEVEILQSYSIFRNIMLNNNNGTTIFRFENAQNIDYNFLEFVSYALCYEITDGGNYNGKEKKINIKFYLDKNQSLKAKILKKRMLKAFKEFGLDKYKYSFGKVENQEFGEIKITFV